MGRYYAACAPTWHVPRGRTLEWVILYFFVLEGFFLSMSLVPTIGYWCWLAGDTDALLIFTLMVLLLRVRR